MHSNDTHKETNKIWINFSHFLENYKSQDEFTSLTQNHLL